MMIETARKMGKKKLQERLLQVLAAMRAEKNWSDEQLLAASSQIKTAEDAVDVINGEWDWSESTPEPAETPLAEVQGIPTVQPEPANSRRCGSKRQGFACTLVHGHDGDHQAEDTNGGVARHWSDADKPAVTPKPETTYAFTEIPPDAKMPKQARDIAEAIRAIGRPVTRDEVIALMPRFTKGKLFTIFYWHVVKSYRPLGIIVENRPGKNTTIK